MYTINPEVSPVRNQQKPILGPFLYLVNSVWWFIQLQWPTSTTMVGSTTLRPMYFPIQVHKRN